MSPIILGIAIGYTTLHPCENVSNDRDARRSQSRTNHNSMSQALSTGSPNTLEASMGVGVSFQECPAGFCALILSALTWYAPRLTSRMGTDHEARFICRASKTFADHPQWPRNN